MANKNLLTEAQFKKFMRLARLEPIASDKLSEMYGNPGMRDCKCGTPGCEDCSPGMKDTTREEDLSEDLASLFKEEDEDMPPVDDEVEVEDDMGDMEVADVEVEDDMGDMEMDDTGGDLNTDIESALTGLLDLIDQKLEKAGAGEMMDVETDEEGEGMEDIEGGDSELDVAPPTTDVEVVDDEDLMETVARRVARRLQRESKVDAKSGVIAERIMKRLSKLKA